MLYKTKVAVCSEILTKQATHKDHRVEFLNVKHGGAYRKL